MSALLQTIPEKFVLEVIDGPDRGAQFQVFFGDIKIGRGEENDIVLSDPRCSRLHAILKITEQTIYLEDVGSQNGILVDGQKGSRAFISNGSKISMGNTTFLFKKITSQSLTTGYSDTSLQENKSIPPVIASMLKNPKKIRFYIIVFGVIILAILFLSGSPANKIKNLKFGTQDDEIQNVKERQDELLRQEALSGKNSRQYLDAQSSFTNGLRDYREGLYKSAAASFNATLAIFPNHPTAHRYLVLAQQKLSEKIQLQLQEGNRLMSEAKYQNAKSAYQQVMLLVGDTQNKTYQEAKEKYNECVLLLRNNF